MGGVGKGDAQGAALRSTECEWTNQIPTKQAKATTRSLLALLMFVPITDQGVLGAAGGGEPDQARALALHRAAARQRGRPGSHHQHHGELQHNHGRDGLALLPPCNDNLHRHKMYAFLLYKLVESFKWAYGARSR